MAMIKVRNVRTGVVSEMTTDQWEKIKDIKQWHGVFKPISEPEPAEVRQIRDRKKNSLKPKSDKNNGEEQPIEQGEASASDEKED